METTPLSTALTTFLSDPANAKAMMKTLVAAACNSSADNAGATALGGNYVHLLVDKSTGDIKFRSEADDAAVASEMNTLLLHKLSISMESGETLTLLLRYGFVFMLSQMGTTLELCRLGGSSFGTIYHSNDSKFVAAKGDIWGTLKITNNADVKRTLNLLAFSEAFSIVT